MSESQGEVAAPQVVLPETVRLAEWRPASVMVVGGGGIGARIVQSLSKLLPEMGIHRMTVVDPDRVEMRNLGRQPFVEPDVGRYKAEVLAERYSSSDSVLRVEAMTGKVEEMPQADLGSTLVIAGLDSPGPRGWLKWMAERSGVPYIDAGNDGPAGQVVLATAQLVQLPEYQMVKVNGWRAWPELFPDPPINNATGRRYVTEEEDPIASCAQAVDTQTVMANIMAATLSLQFLMKVVGGGRLSMLGVRFHTSGMWERIGLTVADRQAAAGRIRAGGGESVMVDPSAEWDKQQRVDDELELVAQRSRADAERQKLEALERKLAEAPRVTHPTIVDEAERVEAGDREEQLREAIADAEEVINEDCDCDECNAAREELVDLHGELERITLRNAPPMAPPLNLGPLGPELAGGGEEPSDPQDS